MRDPRARNFILGSRFGKIDPKLGLACEKSPVQGTWISSPGELWSQGDVEKGGEKIPPGHGDQPSEWTHMQRPNR